ncbi:unnamed protein product [Prorocentrum cordatum]|uniref:Glycine cleavage system H protein n=1 Tax=Prorocentrum cordatum TaxID=2364126 RepID=A0ABN9XAT7_9DINO|nr:unnamed protein product [Polarella glacialis]
MASSRELEPPRSCARSSPPPVAATAPATRRQQPASARPAPGGRRGSMALLRARRCCRPARALRRGPAPAAPSPAAPVPLGRADGGGSTSQPSSHGRFFTKTHEWMQVEEDGIATVGVTQIAQRALGEVVFCRLPREGQRFQQMETLATLEALKTVGEVKCPVHGEVLEVNPRLEREPALVTHMPLSEGWLVRLAFSGRVPRYLQRARAVARSEVEGLLADSAGLQAFLRRRMLFDDGSEQLQHEEELIFDGLRSDERLWLHRAAEGLGLLTSSHGSGAGRKLVVRRPPAAEDDASDEARAASDGAEQDEQHAPARRGRGGRWPAARTR